MIRRFALQEHTVAPGDRHFDLMIEDQGVLVTFQLDEPPGSGPVTGRCSFDHRLRYLSYEGELTRGRGAVRLWDSGHVSDEDGTPRSARYTLRFKGSRLKGRCLLERQPKEAVCLSALEFPA